MAVRDARGARQQVAWYERGFGLDVPAWRRRLESSGRAVAVERLGPLLVGVSGLAVEPGG